MNPAEAHTSSAAVARWQAVTQESERAYRALKEERREYADSVRSQLEEKLLPALFTADVLTDVNPGARERFFESVAYKILRKGKLAKKRQLLALPEYASLTSRLSVLRARAQKAKWHQYRAYQLHSLSDADVSLANAEKLFDYPERPQYTRAQFDAHYFNIFPSGSWEEGQVNRFVNGLLYDGERSDEEIVEVRKQMRAEYMHTPYVQPYTPTMLQRLRIPAKPIAPSDTVVFAFETLYLIAHASSPLPTAQTSMFAESKRAA